MKMVSNLGHYLMELV